LKRFKKNEFGGPLNNTIILFVMLIWSIFQIFPLFWLFLSSFKPTVDIQTNMFGFPSSFYLGNYDFSFFNYKGILLGTYIKNSIIITLSSLIILMLLSLPASYAIAKLKIRGKNIFIIIFIAMMGIPIHSAMVPLYYFIAKLGLLSNYFGLIFPYVAFNFPFSTLLLQTFFRQFPDEIIEASKIDGCSSFGTFIRVVFPISLGAVSSVMIIMFLNIWNEFLFSLIIMKNNTAKTLPVGLMAFRGQYVIDWGPMFAALAISVIPPIILYSIFHRNIIKGMTTGAIKE